METTNYLDIQKPEQTNLRTLFSLTFQNKFVIDFTDFDYEILSSKDHSKILKNVLDGFPLKHLVFKEDLQGRLHPFAMTKEVLYPIHLFLNVDVMESYDKLSESDKAKFQQYKFTYIVQRPSQNYDVSRIQQY